MPIDQGAEEERSRFIAVWRELIAKAKRGWFRPLAPTCSVESPDVHAAVGAVIFRVRCERPVAHRGSHYVTIWGPDGPCGGVAWQTSTG